MAETNYRLTIIVEMDTDSRPRAERWAREVEEAISRAVPTVDLLTDSVELVDEYGDVVEED